MTKIKGELLRWHPGLEAVSGVVYSLCNSLVLHAGDCNFWPGLKGQLLRLVVWLEYHDGVRNPAACMPVLFVGVAPCIHSVESCHLRVCHELKIMTSTLSKQRQSVAERFDSQESHVRFL